MALKRTSVKVLTEARQLLRKGFTKGALAKDAEEREVRPVSPFAVMFCGVGAVARASGGFYTPAIDEPLLLLDTACKQLYGRSPYGVNDEFGKTAILKAFAAAIAEAKRLEKEARRG